MLRDTARDRSVACTVMDVPPPVSPPPRPMTPPDIGAPEEEPADSLPADTVTLSIMPWPTGTNSSTLASTETRSSKNDTFGDVPTKLVRVIVIRARTAGVVMSPSRSRGTWLLFVARSQLAPLLTDVSTANVEPAGTVAVQRTTDPVTGVPGRMI